MRLLCVTSTIALSFFVSSGSFGAEDASGVIPGADGVLLDISEVAAEVKAAIPEATAEPVGELLEIVAAPVPANADSPVEAAAPKGPTAEAVASEVTVSESTAPESQLTSPAVEPAREEVTEEVNSAVEEVDDAVQGVPVEIPDQMPVVEEVSASDAGADAATGDGDDSAFRAIVDAMRPSGNVDSLENDRLTLYISEKVISPQFERDAKRLGLEKSRMHVGFLVSEERDTVLQAGLSVDSSFAKSLRLSFGTRAYIALLGVENADTFATAFGAEAAYKLPFEALALEFGASFYYAPDILTFGSGDRVIDTQVGVALPFRPQLSLFGGVRFLQVDTRPEDREIDNRAHLGVRWDFQ